METVTIQTLDDAGNVIAEETTQVVRISGPHQFQKMLELTQSGLSFEDAAAVNESIP